MQLHWTQIIQQIENPDTYVPRVNACKTCLFQENKARQVNTPQDKLDLTQPDSEERDHLLQQGKL